MAQERIQIEFNAIEKNPPANCLAVTIDDKDICHWQATIIGPEDSLYAGGVFVLDIRFPVEYPFKPPNFKFTTRIYHMNIDSNGRICLNTLNDFWSPALNVAKIIFCIDKLLKDPDPFDSLEPQISDMYKTNRAKHNAIAKEWTQKYAMSD